MRQADNVAALAMDMPVRTTEDYGAAAKGGAGAKTRISAQVRAVMRG
jgi:hypothetical protein